MNGRAWETVVDEHEAVIAALRALGPTLESIAASIIGALRSGKRVYVFGNGGSAADAQHVACELLGRFKRERPALPVVALTTDTSALTAISNDLGYDQVFARQLEGLIRPGDIAWAISTSGTSPNVLAAARVARERDAVVVGFTGRGGGELATLCDHLLRVPHDSSDRIQEGHELAFHYLCEKIEAATATG